MSTDTASGLQHISNLIYASDIKDSKEFDQFCQKELQETEQFIMQYRDFISLETFMFHVFFLLEYRIDDSKMPLSDRTIEKAFQFIQHIAPFYKSSFCNNVDMCLTRCLSYCGMYLDHEERLLIPKELSENTILSILQCTKTLLTLVDDKTIEPFMTLLTTPVDDDQISSHSSWYCKQFLPTLTSSPSKDYLCSSRFLPTLSILLYNLNSLITHESHQIASLALSTCEVLMLVTQQEMWVPFLPSFLSTLAISIRSDALMTWRERCLTLLLFAQGLICLPAKRIESSKPSVETTIASWLDQMKGVSAEGPEVSEVSEVSEISEVSELPQDQSLMDSQSKRVIQELSSKIPRLIEIIFSSFSVDLHTNLRLVILHACYLLLQPCIHYFPTSFLLLLDQLVTELHSDHQLINRLAVLLLDAIPSLIRTNEDLRMLLFPHINTLLFSLVKYVKHATDFANTHTLRKIINYCLLFQSELPEILSLHGSLTEEMYTLYTTLKECLSIQQIVTVGITVPSQTIASRCYTIHYRYCNEQTSSLVLSLIQLLGKATPSLENEVILWLLADCFKENASESALFGMYYLDHYDTLTPSIREFITSVFDTLQYSTIQTPELVAMNLLMITHLLTHTHSVDEFKPMLLSTLFHNRVLLDRHGIILSCLQQVMHYYQYESLSSLIISNYDYLFDSLLVKIHCMMSLQQSDLLSQYIQILTSLWEDLLKEKEITSEFLPYIKDSVQISIDLFHEQQTAAVDLLVPISVFCVRACQDLPEQSKGINAESVDDFLDWYFQKKIVPHLDTLQSKEAFDIHNLPMKEEAMDSTVTEDEPAEKEEYILLKSIVDSIKYIFTYSSSIHVIQSIVQIFLNITKLPFCEEQFYLLNRVRPFFYSLLNDPNQVFYKDMISVYLRIIELDNQATLTYLQDDCWPSIKKALLGCIQATRGDYEVIHNHETAVELEKSLVQSICSVYLNSFIFEAIAFELCEVIDVKSTSNLPDHYVMLLKRICQYNNDAIEQYLFATYDFVQSENLTKLKCNQFTQKKQKLGNSVNSAFISAIQECKLLDYHCFLNILFNLVRPNNFSLRDFKLKSIFSLVTTNTNSSQSKSI